MRIHFQTPKSISETFIEFIDLVNFWLLEFLKAWIVDFVFCLEQRMFASLQVKLYLVLCVETHSNYHNCSVCTLKNLVWNSHCYCFSFSLLYNINIILSESVGNNYLWRTNWIHWWEKTTIVQNRECPSFGFMSTILFWDNSFSEDIKQRNS